MPLELFGRHLTVGEHRMRLVVLGKQDFDKLLCMMTVVVAVVVKLHRFEVEQKVVGQQNQINNLILGHMIEFLVFLPILKI